MLYHIWTDPIRGLLCKPHILNEYDKGVEFRVEIIEPMTLYDVDSGQLAKINGFVNSNYKFHLKYDGEYFFSSADNTDSLTLNDILEMPESSDDINNYQYVSISAWSPC